MMVHVQRVPVVHAGPLELAVGDPEPEGMDQMQPRPRDRAQAAHVARVLRNLRLEQHDVQHASAVIRPPFGCKHS